MHSKSYFPSASSPHDWSNSDLSSYRAPDLPVNFGEPSGFENFPFTYEAPYYGLSSGETRVSEPGQVAVPATDESIAFNGLDLPWDEQSRRENSPGGSFWNQEAFYGPTGAGEELQPVPDDAQLAQLASWHLPTWDALNMSASPARPPAPASPQVQSKIQQYRSSTPGYEKRATSPRPPLQPENAPPYPPSTLPPMALPDRSPVDTHLGPLRDMHQPQMSMPRPPELSRPPPAPEMRYPVDVRHGQPHEMRPGPPGPPPPVPPGPHMDPRIGPPPMGHPPPMDRGPPAIAITRPLQQPLGDTGAPPLIHFDNPWGIRNDRGQEVPYQIHARIDKGFELASNQWICYRRNYFSLVGSFQLQTDRPSASYEVYSKKGPEKYMTSQFALGISAQTDREHPRPVELVQLTTKRDKGPQGHPPVVRLQPQNFQHHNYQNPESDFVTHSQTVANFERIQFKSATQNNGKRRAAQEFYRLKMVLLAEVDTKDKEGNVRRDSQGRAIKDWIPLGSRMTGPLVVRGRSPGHYREEDAKALAGIPSESRPAGVPPMIMPNQGYSVPLPYGYPAAPSYPYPPYHQQPMYHVPALNLPHHSPPRDNNLGAPSAPVLSEEEKKSIEEPSGYKYYPFALYEAIRDSSRTRPGSSVSPKPGGSSDEKENLPAIWGGSEQAFYDYMGRKLQRYDAFKTSEGHFPPLRVL